MPPESKGEQLAAAFFQLLEVIKNILVILTCITILYLVVQGYVALQDWSERMQQLGTNLGGMGG